MLTRHRFTALFTLCLITLVSTIPLAATATAQDQEPGLLDGLEWRFVGPYRGGRVTTVSGVRNQPNLYYMGATGGGVWKTENAGASWTNLSDGYFNVGTIGAVAVAESDPNVLYVGTGESPIRGVTTSHGDGVWKSTDAGKTWSHVGLKESGQISRIRIHPTDPDTAWVAVQGQIWGPNAERGIFRTTDGGESWEHVLQVNDSTGASDLTVDPGNPRILYAAMWTHGRKPWYIQSGSREGGIFKSTDGGGSWTKLKGGLPAMVGKIAVDVAASNPNRVYALIESEPEKGGLWRSDDAGASWKLIDGHRVLHSRAWYYIHITADPTDENTVYVMNVPLMKSIDGGKSWEKLSTPHSDHHDHWINPDDGRNMISANDGGATVTFDGGKTWSSISNQPTAQFYRVSTDNQVPFRIYGGQQDSSTMSIASRSLNGGIGVADYYDVGGGESAHIAFDPDDPRIVYATSINGTLTEYDHQTGLERSIIPYPEVVWGQDSRNLKYRTNWNAPVALSPHDPSIIYYGTQYLMKSTDRGVTWQTISPDLTRNDPEKQGRNGGPLTPENVGAEFYNTVFYIMESPHEAGTIWVGADDGLLHLTRDGGENWTDVSPPHKTEAMINAIEISPHDPATVFVAMAGYKLNDFRPYIYRSDNHGKRWKRIDSGLPDDTFVRVVREDPERQGLLYAGTEAGMFVSFDNGDSWQSLKLNLPPVPITDLSVRQGSLVAATQGRGFWVLDDLFAVHSADAGDGLQLFAADETVMMETRGWGSAPFEGQNPASGAALYYRLGESREEPLTIEIFDADDRLVRRYFSEEGEFERCKLTNMDPRSPYKPKYPPRKAGLNKWNWDGTRQPFQCVNDTTMFAGHSGPSVPPGSYRARISQGGEIAEARFSLKTDPRKKTPEAGQGKWTATIDEASSLLDDVLNGLASSKAAQEGIRNLVTGNGKNPALQGPGKAALAALEAWDARLVHPLHETWEDEDAWETRLVGQLKFALDVIDGSGAPVSAGSLERLADLREEWHAAKADLAAIQAEHIDPINRQAQAAGIPHIPNL